MEFLFKNYAYWKFMVTISVVNRRSRIKVAPLTSIRALIRNDGPYIWRPWTLYRKIDYLKICRCLEVNVNSSTLEMESLTIEERVDALLSLKHCAAGVPDCKLTKEIINLCEREAELLMRGINPGQGSKSENISWISKLDDKHGKMVAYKLQVKYCYILRYKSKKTCTL